MSATYEPIESVTLTSDVAGVTFDAIAPDWTDLVVSASLRSNESPPHHQIRVSVNGLSGGTYSSTLLYGDGSAAGSGRYPNMPDKIEPQFIPGVNDPAGLFGISTWNFMSYANTNVYKTILVSETHVGVVPYRSVYLARTTQAITKISFEASRAQGALVAGSTLSLFGIKAAP